MEFNKSLRDDMNRFNDGKNTCPVCGKHMQDNGVLCSGFPECRYDASMDYQLYPALQQIGSGIKTVSALSVEYVAKQKRIKKKFTEEKLSEELVSQLKEENASLIEKNNILLQKNEDLVNKSVRLEGEKKELEKEKLRLELCLSYVNSSLAQENENHKAAITRAEKESLRKNSIVCAYIINIIIIVTILLFDQQRFFENRLVNIDLVYISIIIIMAGAVITKLAGKSKPGDVLTYLIASINFFLLAFIAGIFSGVVDDKIKVCVILGIFIQFYTFGSLVIADYLSLYDPVNKKTRLIFFIICLIIFMVSIVFVELFDHYREMPIADILLSYSGYKVLAISAIAVLEYCRVSYRQKKAEAKEKSKRVR